MTERVWDQRKSEEVGPEMRVATNRASMRLKVEEERRGKRSGPSPVAKRDWVCAKEPFSRERRQSLSARKDAPAPESAAPLNAGGIALLVRRALLVELSDARRRWAPLDQISRNQFRRNDIVRMDWKDQNSGNKLRRMGLCGE